MFVAVCLHLVETVTALATPGFVSGILQCIKSHTRGRIYACILNGLKHFQVFRVVIFRLLNPLKGNVSLALVTSTKPLYMFGSQLVVWCLRLVKTVPNNVVLKW
jgi:hypothetical protein